MSALAPTLSNIAPEIRVCAEETLFGINTNPKNIVVAHVAGPFLSAAKVAAFALKFIFDLVILIPMSFSGACRSKTTIGNEFKISIFRLGADIRGIGRNMIKMIPVAGLYAAKGFNKLTYQIAGGNAEDSKSSSSAITCSLRGRAPARQNQVMQVVPSKSGAQALGLTAHKASAGSVSTLAKDRGANLSSSLVDIFGYLNRNRPDIALGYVGLVLADLQSGGGNIPLNTLANSDILQKLIAWALSDLNSIRINRSRNGISEVIDLDELQAQLQECNQFESIIHLTGRVVATLIESERNLSALPGAPEFMEARLRDIQAISGDLATDEKLVIGVLNLCRLQIEDDIFWSEGVRATRVS